MGFGQAYLNVQLHYQKLMDTPFYFDFKKRKLVANPKFSNKVSRLRIPYWHLTIIVLILSFLYCLYHCLNLYHNYKVTRVSPRVDEVLIYCTVLTMDFCALATMHTYERNPIWFTQIGSEILFALGRLKYLGWPTKNRLPDIEEIAGYIIAGCLLIAPLNAIAIPWILTFDPINLIFQNILADVERRILASFIYGFFTLTSILFLVPMMLFNLSACQIIEEVVQMNYHNSIGPVLTKKLNDNFHASVHLHNMISLVINPGNKNISLFLPCVSGVAISIAIISNYACLTLYHRTDIRLIVCSGAVVSLSAYFIITFLSRHAAKPLKYSRQMIQRWKNILIAPDAKRQARAMQPVAIMMGPFFKIEDRTGIDLLNVVMEYTVTLLIS